MFFVVMFFSIPKLLIGFAKRLDKLKARPLMAILSHDCFTPSVTDRSVGHNGFFLF